jgi:DNA modification methylase
MAKLKIQTMKVAELTPADYNPRTISDEALNGLTSSLAEFGTVQPIIWNKRTKRIVGGHQRAKALEQMGETETEVVVVSIPAAKEKALNIALNNPAIAGEFSDGLQALLTQVQGDDLDLFTNLRLDELLEGTGTEEPGEPTEPDEGPEIVVPEDAVTNVGDLWILGDHRLLCADSTIDENVDKAIGDKVPAMFCMDPPYAIYGSSTGLASDIVDDKMVRPFFEAIFRQCARVLPWYSHIYTFCDWRSWAAIWESAKRAKIAPQNMLVWDKGGGGLGSNYANCFELVAYLAKIKPVKHMRSKDEKGGKRLVYKPNILRHTRPHGDERQHNAAKPIALCEGLIDSGSDVGGLVVDLFGGSGTTLLAAEKQDRPCSILELEPRFADVIVDRWQNLTGGKAKRV